MRRLFLLAILACAFSVVPSAGAILGGDQDAPEAHPYVAYLQIFQVNRCTGVFISPTKVVTAAHCFPPGSTVQVFPYWNGPAGGPPVTGTFVPHPDFCKPPACTGDPSDPAFFVTDDVAVVKLSQPVALSRYAELPKIEKSQGKGKVQKHVGKDVSLLGYGVQAFVPFPVSDFTRTIAQEELSQPIPVAADKFVQIDQEAAGFCLGDSGGPVLEKKKDVVLAISSSNSDVETCLGPALAYRLDSEAAQSFIQSVG
jgi:Trypsin